MRMTNTNITICALLAALTGCVACLGYVLWENHLWKEQVRSLAALHGVARAKEDFETGKLRLFVLEDRLGAAAFRGSNEGPFKVEVFSTLPFTAPSRYAGAYVVEWHNRRMREFQAHPERWVSTNAEGRIEWK